MVAQLPRIRRSAWRTALVTRSPIAGEADLVPDSIVVFEVLSDSGAVTDRATKNAEYRATPSIQHYVMLEQTERAATVFSRLDNDWIGSLLIGDAALSLPGIGVELPLADIYAGVELTEGDD
jgi:Uma2 family endonuclease